MPPIHNASERRAASGKGVTSSDGTIAGDEGSCLHDIVVSSQDVPPPLVYKDGRDIDLPAPNLLGHAFRSDPPSGACRSETEQIEYLDEQPFA